MSDEHCKIQSHRLSFILCAWVLRRDLARMTTPPLHQRENYKKVMKIHIRVFCHCMSIPLRMDKSLTLIVKAQEDWLKGWLELSP